MTTAGWIFMIVSWAIIIGLFAFCMRRTLKPQDKTHQEENRQSEAQSQE